MDQYLLATGGAGFIGSHVVRAILSTSELATYKVVVLDDLSGGFRSNIPQDSRVEFVKGSITDEPLVKRLFRLKKFDYVFHFAAYAAEGLSHFIRQFNYTNNLIGSVNLINASVRTNTRCFVFTSSIAVYGAGQVPMREEMVPAPEDPYGISKYAVELDLKAAHEMFGLNYVVFRPHNVYGEYQNIGDKYRNVVGIFMNQILQGKPMTIFGDGTQQRAFSYVGDIAPVVARSPLVDRARNCVFNIGADQSCTVLELAQEVARAMGVAPRLLHLSPRQEVLHAFCDHSAFYRVFGKGKQTPLYEGVNKMAAWAKKAGVRKSKEFKKLEVLRSLPSAWVPTTGNALSAA